MQKKLDKLSKIMIYAIVFCCASPFLYLAFVQFTMLPSDVDIMTYMEQDPTALINMLAAFINPFAALALNHTRKRLLEYAPADEIYRNISLLLIGELCMRNMLYICVMIYLLYKARVIYKEKYRIAWRAGSIKKFCTTAAPSLTVLVLYLLVGVLMIRVTFFV